MRLCGLFGSNQRILGNWVTDIGPKSSSQPELSMGGFSLGSGGLKWSKLDRSVGPLT